MATAPVLPGPVLPNGAETLVGGEYPFTAEDLRRIAALLHDDAGIALPDAKAALIYSRLAKRLRALGLRSFRDYCNLVASLPRGEGERREMLAALTTNVTRFYREPHHFQHLSREVIPALVAEARRGGRGRIWSAGCSSGQEAYTIALALLEKAPEAATLDLRVLATDIDPNMVAEGRAGLYRAEQLAPVPADLRARWFEPAEDGMLRAGEALRRMVAFRELNLNGAAWPMRHRFQAIFCRNVAIYFDDATQATLWSRFAAASAPGGWLYIGHSERINGPAASRWRSAGLTTYRLQEGA